MNNDQYVDIMPSTSSRQLISLSQVQIGTFFLLFGGLRLGLSVEQERANTSFFHNDQIIDKH